MLLRHQAAHIGAAAGHLDDALSVNPERLDAAEAELAAARPPAQQRPDSDFLLLCGGGEAGPCRLPFRRSKDRPLDVWLGARGLLCSHCVNGSTMFGELVSLPPAAAASST